MTPVYNTIISILCLAIITHCWAEDNTITETQHPSTEKAILKLPVTSENHYASQLTALGFQHMLTGHKEAALLCFLHATEIDSQCVLAHTGILTVAAPGSDIYREHLKDVNTLLNQVILTPIEEWYIATYLQYTAGDVSGAAAAFKERAARYRKDTSAACWDIVLAHYCSTESISELQRRADTLLQKNPDNGVVHFCRALIEENEKRPSEIAIHSSLQAARDLPQNPRAQLLAGKFQFCLGKHTDAAKFFEKARNLSADSSESKVCAELFLIASYIQSGKSDSWMQALQMARKLALNSPLSVPQTDSDILYHWEGRTMLLRMLALQETPPSGQAINLAAKTSNAPAGDAVELAQNCLVYAIRARSLAQTDRKSTAEEQLKKAEQQYQLLQKAGEDIIRQGGLHRICFQRASQACMACLYRAKIALYSSSKIIWQEHMNEVLNIPQPRFFPPVLPSSLPPQK